MPEQAIRFEVRRLTRWMRVTAIANGALGGAAAAGVAYVTARSMAGAVVAAVLVAIVATVVGWRRCSDKRTAGVLDREAPGGDNLIVTAQEVIDGRPIHPIVAAPLAEQAGRRLAAVGDAGIRRASWVRLAFGVIAVAAVGLMMSRPQGTSIVRAPASGDASEHTDRTSGTLRATVTPPPYTRQSASSYENPVQIEALEGSSVLLRMAGVTDVVELVEPGRDAERFARSGEDATFEFPATRSRILLVRQPSAGGRGDRLLNVRVVSDERPVVTIERPGRDLLFGAATGTVPVIAVARDDLEVASLALRYTKISGSGETFSFQEGEVPLKAASGGGPVLEGRASLVLPALALEDGDTLVYRAIARDGKPGADPSTSESYVIEIGRRGEASSAGFALPQDRDRQALSQQMLIVKTERLHAGRDNFSADAFLEQSRLLAVEQRMVRAEFVFMTGGEVVDEVEEAEHSHDLEQGRFENEGQIELLNATREMSRAEARLNAGDTVQALVFERSALAALQRAFDRRRYFLRTLPERTRIDQARRLSGDASTAHPQAAQRQPQARDAIDEQLRLVILALAGGVQAQKLDAALAARVLRFDPASPALQPFAIAVSSDPGGALDAAREAQAHLRALLQRRLGVAPSDQIDRDPLVGALSSAPRPGGGGR